MKFQLIVLFIFSDITLFAQHEVLVLGNSRQLDLEIDSNITVHYSDSLPETLEAYSSVMIFSTAYSFYDSTQLQQVYEFVNEGGGLYCGADNLPLQSEFNQISNELIGKASWGNFKENKALSNHRSKLKVYCSDTIDAGETPVAVPLKVGMQVEAWIKDEPIITSMKYGQGIIVFDGGYSRFYAPVSSSAECVLQTLYSLLNKEGLKEDELLEGD